MPYKMQPEKLASFGRAPYSLLTALRQFPKKMWLFEPASNQWSIHKTILHLADSEASAYICCRRYIAENGSLDLRFDSARWAETLGYCHQSTREALEIIRRLRKATYGLLVAFQEGAQANGPGESPGGELSLDDWLEYHQGHIVHHIVQMKQNYNIWQRSHPPRKSASASQRLIGASPSTTPATRV
jgi:hypothetical protein